MVERLSESQMKRLAEIYRDHECLWNIKNIYYKDRFVRENAYVHICDSLNIPGLQAKDVPKKIKNLRSSYYQELKKIENSKRNGVTDLLYKPKVSWFKIADDFLKSCIKKERVSNVDENSNSDGVLSDDDSENPKSDAIHDTKSGENSNSINLMVGGQQIEDNNYGNVNTGFREQSQAVLQPNCPLQRPAKRFRCDKKYDHIDNIYEAIKRIDENITLQNDEDEFDSFGKYIAVTLRSLPRQLSIVAKVELQKAISELQLKSIGENTSSLSQHSDNSVNSFGIDHSRYIMSTTTTYPVIKSEYSEDSTK